MESDSADNHHNHRGGASEEHEGSFDANTGHTETDVAHLGPKPRQLPDDLPTSLDDRRSVPAYQPETEMYDAWQGGCDSPLCVA